MPENNQHIENKIGRHEHQKNDGRLLYKIVEEDLWYDWNKVKVDLAKWATGKYISYKEDPEWNAKQNDKIRQKILSGEAFQPNLDQSISKFSWQKQEKIKQIVWDWEFTISRVDSYISNLPQDKADILDKLPDEKFVWFIHQEMEYSKNISDKLSKSYGPEVQTTTKEQLANIVILSNVDEKLKNYISGNKQFEHHYKKSVEEVDDRFLKVERKELELKIKKEEIQRLRTEFKTPEKRKEIEEKEIIFQQEVAVFQKQEEVVLLNEYGGVYEAAKKHVLLNVVREKMKWSDEYKLLDETKKAEFEQIAIEIYNYNETISPVLNEKYFPDMKLEIEQKEKKSNQSNLNISNSFSSSQSIILQSPEFNTYFKDHYINEFVSEDQKDHSYRDNLQKLYPESKKIIQASFLWMAEYAQCFDKEWNIIDEEVNKLPKDQKNLFDEKIKEKLATVDKEFNWNINTLIKEQSVETCLDTLNKCMNIKFDDWTKEDMLKNFDFSSKVNDGLIVDFVGSINGKKINLSYDMKTGSVSYQEYLFKDKETNTFKKNDPTSKSEMPFVQLPKLDDFVSASKSLDYVQDMKSVSTIDQFNSTIKDKLNNQVQKNIDIKDARENFEKVMLQDMVMQEVFAFMWYGDMKKLSNIDKAQEPNLYKLYSMIYSSISFYSKDELKSFRESIKTLWLQKSKISENYNNLNVSKEVMERDFDLNQERIFFDLSMNKSISKLYSKKESEKNTYLWFFECFIKEETKPLLIIDIVKLQNYISKLNSEVNKDVDNVLNWKRNDVFKKNLWRFRDSYDVLAIEKSF